MSKQAADYFAGLPPEIASDLRCGKFLNPSEQAVWGHVVIMALKIKAASSPKVTIVTLRLLPEPLLIVGERCVAATEPHDDVVAKIMSRILFEETQE